MDESGDFRRYHTGGGTARGTYTFGNHLKWSRAVAIGYAASIVVHLWINAKHF